MYLMERTRALKKMLLLSLGLVSIMAAGCVTQSQASNALEPTVTSAPAPVLPTVFVETASATPPTSTNAPSAIPPIATATPPKKAVLSECGKIEEPGEYSLDTDLTSAGADQCLLVSADNAALDCRGHSISSNHKGTGIQITNSNSVTVVNCIISKFYYAVKLENSEGVQVSDNTLKGTYHGIWLSDTNSSEIIGNSIGNFTSGYAMHLNNSHGNRIALNNLGVAKYSALLLDSDGNFFANNSMYQSLNGAVYASNSQNNTFQYNNMSASPKLESRHEAVFLISSPGNSFFGNDMCSPGLGINCVKGAATDAGGNACLAQSGCGMTCLACPEDFH